jgi:hypothetical protein
MVVPMFAPITIGTALSKFKAPPATSPTTMDVVVEELWIRLVATIPMSNPAKGLEVI